MAFGIRDMERIYSRWKAESFHKREGSEVVDIQEQVSQMSTMHERLHLACLVRLVSVELEIIVHPV